MTESGYWRGGKKGVAEVERRGGQQTSHHVRKRTGND